MRPLDLFAGQKDKTRIAALGELLVDFVPENDSVFLASPGKIIKTASGSSGIVACAAADMGEDAGFLGKVGKDPLSRFVYEGIAAQGVDLSCVVESDEGQIGLAFIEYTETGRNYQFYRKKSVGSGYCAAEVDEAYVKNCFAVHYSGMLLELSPEMRSACQRMVEIAKANGVIVSFDPNIRKELLSSEDAQERMAQAIATADMIAPTLEEARMVTGETELRDVIRRLHEMGPSIVAITRDAHGAVLSCGGEVVEVPGIAVNAVDPTGAGDTFAAALMTGLRRGYDLTEMIRYANCAGALACSKRGVIGVALPSDEQIRRLMDRCYGSGRMTWKAPAIRTGLGVTTNSFEQPLRNGEITMEQLLEEFGSLGFSWVELRDQNVELTPRQCLEIRDLAARQGLRVHYAWNNADLTLPQENFDRALENASVFGHGTCCRIVIAPETVKVHDGYSPKDLEKLLPRMEQMIARAAEKGIRLCFENSMETIEDHDGYVGMNTLLGRVNGMLSTFDAANMTSQVKAGCIGTRELVDYYQAHREQIPYYHLKTSRNRQAPAPFLEENGDFRLGELLNAFDSSVLVCLELPAQKTAAEIRNYVRESLAFLREGGYIND